jgi:hypothetical protein
MAEDADREKATMKKPLIKRRKLIWKEEIMASPLMIGDTNCLGAVLRTKHKPHPETSRLKKHSGGICYNVLL